MTNPCSFFGFLVPASYSMFDIVFLHHYMIFFLMLVFALVSWLLVYIMRCPSTPNTKKFIFSHCSLLEILWTTMPMFVLGLVALPSLSSLYNVDNFLQPEFSFKVTGNQWFWTYEVSDTDSGNCTFKSFDSYLMPKKVYDLSDELCFSANYKQFHYPYYLLSVDKFMVLPVDTNVSVLVTSSDVLHSFSVPAFGLKIDCCPGSLNQIFVNIFRTGYFFGQCSELCLWQDSFTNYEKNSVNVLY